MRFVFYIVAQYGLAYVVGVSAASFPLRVAIASLGRVGRIFVQMLECAACFGVWSGLVAALLGAGDWLELAFPHGWLALVALPAFTAASNLLVIRVLFVAEQRGPELGSGDSTR